MSIAAQMEQQGYLTTKAAAEHASVSYHTMRNWAQAGKVETKRKAGKVYISRVSVDRFLEEE